MPYEYHVIIVPFLPWAEYTPKSLVDLKTLSDIVDRFFSFDFHSLQKHNEKAQPNSAKPLLGGRVKHLTSEITNLWNITNKTFELSAHSKQDIAKLLKVEGTFVTDYSLEIVSSSPDLISEINADWAYKNLCGILVDFLYGTKLPFKISSLLKPIFDPAHRAMTAVVCRLILCDNLNEINSLSSPTTPIKKIDNGLFFLGSFNAFNFTDENWKKPAIPNTIVMLKPEALEKMGFFSSLDELAILLMALHCVGKTYAISESSEGLRANLEWTSWYLDDLFEEFEKRYNLIRRSIFNLEKNANKNEKQIRYAFVPIARLSTIPDVSSLIRRAYGTQAIDYLDQIFTLTSDDRAQKYGANPILAQLAFAELRELGLKLSSFLSALSTTSFKWADAKRSQVNHSQLLLAMAALIIAIILGILQNQNVDVKSALEKLWSFI